MQQKTYKELKQIEQYSFPFAIRISQKPSRTKLCVQIYPMKSEVYSPISGPRTVKVYFNIQQKLEQNEQQFQSNLQQDCHDFSLQKNEKSIFYQDQVEQQNQQLKQRATLFHIILYHGIYPFEAPLVTISSSPAFPVSGEFKNYFYDIIEAKAWWPTITVKDVIQKLPHFAYVLQKRYSQNLSFKEIGSYPYNYPFFIQDIKQHAKYFLVIQCVMKCKKQSSRMTFIGLTSQYLLVLRKNKEQKSYFIEKKFKTSDIIQINYKKNSQKSEISILLNNQRCFLIYTNKKIRKISAQDKYLLYFYLKYYQVLKTLKLSPGQQHRIQIVETLNEFIELADLTNHQQAIEWATKQLRKITHSFSKD